jgi:hypothetical protein
MALSGMISSSGRKVGNFEATTARTRNQEANNDAESVDVKRNILKSEHESLAIRVY